MSSTGFSSVCSKSTVNNYTFSNNYKNCVILYKLLTEIIILLVVIIIIITYKTIILPVVLYGCETWSLTLRDECRLRVFEKKRF